ncbi:MAG: hypothetical protein KTR31_30585 [Myxococcales bacterium]|nr:hypothetical protein [Myxococcales bacterium]
MTVWTHARAHAHRLMVPRNNALLFIAASQGLVVEMVWLVWRRSMAHESPWWIVAVLTTCMLAVGMWLPAGQALGTYPRGWPAHPTLPVRTDVRVWVESSLGASWLVAGLLSGMLGCRAMMWYLSTGHQPGFGWQQGLVGFLPLWLPSVWLGVCAGLRLGDWVTRRTTWPEGETTRTWIWVLVVWSLALLGLMTLAEQLGAAGQLLGSVLLLGGVVVFTAQPRPVGSRGPAASGVLPPPQTPARGPLRQLFREGVRREFARGLAGIAVATVVLVALDEALYGLSMWLIVCTLLWSGLGAAQRWAAAPYDPLPVAQWHRGVLAAVQAGGTVGGVMVTTLCVFPEGLAGGRLGWTLVPVLSAMAVAPAVWLLRAPKLVQHTSVFVWSVGSVLVVWGAVISPALGARAVATHALWHPDAVQLQLDAFRAAGTTALWPGATVCAAVSVVAAIAWLRRARH